MDRSDTEMLHRAIVELTVAVKELKAYAETTYVRKDVLDPTLAAMRDDIKEHSEWITWATRIVLALVIVAVVGTVIVTGGKR